MAFLVLHERISKSALFLYLFLSSINGTCDFLKNAWERNENGIGKYLHVDSGKELLVIRRSMSTRPEMRAETREAFQIGGDPMRGKSSAREVRARRRRGELMMVVPSIEKDEVGGGGEIFQLRGDNLGDLG